MRGEPCCWHALSVATNWVHVWADAHSWLRPGILLAVCWQGGLLAPPEGHGHSTEPATNKLLLANLLRLLDASDWLAL